MSGSVPLPEEERRRVVDQQFAMIVKRLDDGERTMDSQAQATLALHVQVGAMQRELTENTTATKHSAETIIEVKNILTTFKTLGTFAKWISGIFAAIVTAWAAWKGFAK